MNTMKQPLMLLQIIKDFRYSDHLKIPFRRCSLTIRRTRPGEITCFGEHEQNPYVDRSARTLIS